MDNNLEKIINDIVWWIPFKKLRNNIRKLLTYFVLENTKNKELLVRSIEANKKDTDFNLLFKLLNKEDEHNNIIYPVDIDNNKFYFYDHKLSKIVKYVSDEIGYVYKFDNFSFEEGDIVIDIGANVGIVSIYLAKRFPFIKIYAFEPVKENYNNLIKNIKLNDINEGQIIAENVAITKDGRNVMIDKPITNSGASNIYGIHDHDCEYNKEYNINSVTLDSIFSKYNIEKCKLLKIDCEGSEYEILYNLSENNIKKCDNMIAEFHGKTEEIEKLYAYCSKYIGNIEYSPYIWKDKNGEEFGPDQTRPDQTRPDQTRNNNM